jgi:wobble nucleotide-excising tRNase
VYNLYCELSFRKLDGVGMSKKQKKIIGILQIDSIERYRSFHSFVWGNLEPLSVNNLFYGWNGSGKTTLSTIFRSLEKGDNYCSEGEFKITFNGSEITDLNYENIEELRSCVRVFNQDYVRENIFPSPNSNKLDPIYIVGEKNIENEKLIAKKKEEIKKLDTKLTITRNEFEDASSNLDTFFIDYAKNVIKETLLPSGLHYYANYNKSHMKSAMIKMYTNGYSDERYKHNLLSSDMYNENLVESKITSIKDEKGLELTLPLSVSEISRLTMKAKEILQEKVLNIVIEELKNNPKNESWVRQGMIFHNQDDLMCKYCGNQITTEKFDALTNHFNDKYHKLIKSINDELISIDYYKQISFSSIIREFENVETYNSIQVVRKKLILEYESLYSQHLNVLKSLYDILVAKKDKMNEEVTPKIKDNPKIREKINEINNRVLTEHKKITKNVGPIKERAAKNIELHLIAKKIKDYQAKNANMTNKKESYRTTKEKYEEVRAELSTLKVYQPDMLDSKSINCELSGFIGHNEIKMEPVNEENEKGYRITRNGEPVEHLSEGEKNAIALAYFMISLDNVTIEEKPGFDKTSGVVVIDDPVTSFDSNSLFHACGYIKDKTSNIGQLIVLTHNYYFFKKFRRLLLREKDVNEYMLECTYDTNSDLRSSKINMLHELLRDYETEYHYLFRKLCDASKPANSPDYMLHLNMPNYARQVLETFIHFRYPYLKEKNSNQKLSFTNYLKKCKCNEEDADTIERYTNPLSHRNRINDPSQDSIPCMNETKNIIKTILRLIYNTDKTHFEGMMKSIGVEDWSWLEQN